jgi:serine/threonine-protein kinase
MGAVYEVVHELTGRHHALKLLYESLVYDEVVVARFTQEARSATAIRSPHVVEVTDMGTEGGAPFLVMELLEGEDLGARIARRGSITPLQAVDFIGQACHALACAHALGIIHRDLKPENLFILDGDFVKVLDFGIAKLRRAHDAVGDGLTRDGNLLGTPEYMSPEQITVKSHLDHRADVYSLGVILYEMLAGRLPFEAEQLTELAVLIVTSDPPPLSGYAVALPEGLADVVHAAMAHSASDRPSDCRELARRLAPFGSEESFAWIEDADELEPVDGEPSVRISRPTPRGPAYSVSRARRPRPKATPDDAAARGMPTLDGTLPETLPSSPPEDAEPPTPPVAPSRRLPLLLGAAATLAIGAALAFALRGGDPRTPVHAASHGVQAQAAAPRPTPAPIAAASQADPLARDAGQDDAATRPAEAGVEPETRRFPLRPRVGTNPAHPNGGAHDPEDSHEAPAPLHAPLKNNPFL